MDGGNLGNWIAGAAIIVFLALLILVVARTVFLLLALWILPASHALQKLPVVGRAIARLAERFGHMTDREGNGSMANGAAGPPSAHPRPPVEGKG